MAKQYKRGFTTQAPAPPDQPPPRMKGGVFNEFRTAKARGSVMSPPTGNTQEPRLSKWTGGKNGKGLAKGKGRR